MSEHTDFELVCNCELCQHIRETPAPNESFYTMSDERFQEYLKEKGIDQ